MTYLHFHLASSFDELHTLLMQKEDLMECTKTLDPTPIDFVIENLNIACGVTAPVNLAPHNPRGQPNSNNNASTRNIYNT